MFRALILLMFITGTPQINSPNFIQEAKNFTEVDNFQVLNKNVKNIDDSLSAKSVLAIDLDSQVTLYQKNAEEKLPIASLSKLMTTLIILKEHELHEVVTISNEVSKVIGSRMWLYAGEQMSVENLIKGMLIQSGNDAAYELAKFDSGTLEKFSRKMNQKAFYLGLKNSHFLDPAGLDDKNNYSTAQDLALISKHILKNDFVRKIVSTTETAVFSLNGKIKHNLINTNQLLDSSFGAKGLKTGTTDAAGQCLITLVELNGNDILIIILGSQNRFQDTKTIFNHLH